MRDLRLPHFRFLLLVPVLLVGPAPTSQDPKHTPLIEAPDQVKAGEWVPLTVTVGATLHPSLEDHHVEWITVRAGGKELARAYVGSPQTMPKVTFHIRLEETGTLEVLAQPNHAGSFQATKAITVLPVPGH